MPKRNRAVFMIGQAIVWSAVIVGCALALDSDAFSTIVAILGAGAAVSVVILPAAAFRSLDNS